MTTTLSPAGFGTARFEAFLDSRREPGWLTAARRAAWDRFSGMRWPERHEEEWLRTDIRLFKLDQFGLPIDTPSAADCPAAFLT